MKSAALKCAIYTRKSTERGLEQDFNTLDAQREACLAYITSQKSEGWVPVKHQYDDGGYSGGSLDRPALNLLLEDIRAGKINVVVVYKIDRLTRSLTDFAKLVETFDQYNVSFVSVTQSFNTTTSMGRLTLNVLLSFAQFEREVIGERIRDKIAASKKKGMWMGGCPPLGYDIKDRNLVINEKEAQDVRYIFDRYLEVGSVARLADELKEKGIRSKSWVSRTGKIYTGRHYGFGGLHHLLSNPVYAGYIRHKGEMHDGLQEAIIPQGKWQQVQEALVSKSCTERGHRKQSLKYLLKRKMFDADGAIYTPMRANKGNKQYRYYVSQNRIRNRDTLKNVIARLPAHEIETLVINAVVAEMRDVESLAALLGLSAETDFRTLEYISKRTENVPNIHEAIHKVTVDMDTVAIDICLKRLKAVIREGMDVGLPDHPEENIHTLNVPYHTRRAQRGAVVIHQGEGKDPLDLPKNKLEALVKGIIWRDEHFKGRSFRAIAKENGVDESYIRKSINQAMQYY